MSASISFLEGLESLDIIGQIRSSSCLWLLSNFYKVSYLGKWEICFIFQSKYLNIFLSWWYQMKSVFHSEKCPMFRRSEIITTFWILASIASYCQHQDYMAKVQNICLVSFEWGRYLQLRKLVPSPEILIASPLYPCFLYLYLYLCLCISFCIGSFSWLAFPPSPCITRDTSSSRGDTNTLKYKYIKIQNTNNIPPTTNIAFFLCL